MTQYTYCELSDLEVTQCFHCVTNARNLGPVQPALDEIEED